MIDQIRQLNICDNDVQQRKNILKINNELFIVLNDGSALKQ